MRLKEFVVEDSTKKSTARNYVAKNAQSCGSGIHKDKKKADKRGEQKHKGKQVNESFMFSSLEFRLLESQLDETTIETFTSGHLTYHWIREPEYDAIITNKPQPDGSISLHIVKIGPPKVIASLCKQIKEKNAEAGKKPPMPRHNITADPNIRRVGESATAGATSSANIASVANPHLAIGSKNKSYTGSPGKSGTKSPTPPKMIMQKPGTNALDSNKNIFGSGTVVKRK